MTESSTGSQVQVQALYAYAARSERELGFEKGAVISNVAMLDGPWWKGSIGTTRGAFPATYVKVLAKGDDVTGQDGQDLSLAGLQGVGGEGREGLCKALAKFDYVALKETELSFKKGDTVVEVRKMAGEWWRGSFGGQRGYFPKKYVAVLGEGVAESQRTNVFHSEKPPLARAMFDFVGTAEHELTFKEGDIIGQVEQGDKASPWWQGSRGGRRGYFPREYVVMVESKRRETPFPAQVIYSFTATDESQLSLTKGEQIEVLELCDQITGGWWVGRKGDDVGYFPANYARFRGKACDHCNANKAKAKITLENGEVKMFCAGCIKGLGSAINKPSPGIQRVPELPNDSATKRLAALGMVSPVPTPKREPERAPKPAAAPASIQRASEPARQQQQMPEKPARSEPIAPAAQQALQPAAQPAAQPDVHAFQEAQHQHIQQEQHVQQQEQHVQQQEQHVQQQEQHVQQQEKHVQQQEQHVQQQENHVQQQDHYHVQHQQQHVFADEEEEEEEEDTDDISTDSEEGGPVMTYAEMLRQQYQQHIPAAEDMRKTYGHAPAPPRPE